MKKYDSEKEMIDAAFGQKVSKNFAYIFLIVTIIIFFVLIIKM